MSSSSSSQSSSGLHALELGYTGKCTLNDQMLFLTSLGITHNTNLIKSSATKPIYDGEKFTRFGTAAFKDWSTYEISISFELHTHTSNKEDSSFEQVKKLFKEHFRKPISLKLEAISEDAAELTNRTKHNLYYLQFKRCYVSSFSLSIENNAIATASMNLLYFDEVFPFTEESSSDDSDSSNGVAHGDIFYPYYNWGLKTNDSPVNILNNFSFNFQQSITPKQGISKCNNAFSEAHNSGRPIYVTMSMPTMTFDMTYILTDEQQSPLEVVNDDKQGYNRNNQNLNKLLKHIDFNNASFSSSSPSSSSPTSSHFADLFKFTLVYNNKRSKTGNKETGDVRDFLDVEQSVIESITPNLANSGSVNTISLSGTIYKINEINEIS